MPKTIQQILAENQPGYAPQKQLLRQQEAGLGAQTQAAVQGLDAARTNAFEGIKNDANASGMFYSGRPIEGQNKYVGEQYLPALARVRQAEQDQRFSLQGRLADIAREEYTTAQSMRQQQIEAEAAERRERERLALERQKMQQSYAIAQLRTSTRAAASPAKGYRAFRDSVGGLAYRDANGNPITARMYYDAKGANSLDPIIQDLRNSKNPGDAKIAEIAASGKYTEAELIKKYPRVFRG